MSYTKKHKESLKKNRVLKNLPTSRTFKEACVKAGYSPKSNYIYSIKEDIRGDLEALGYTKEAIEDRFSILMTKAEQTGDLSNANRSLENIARIQGLFKDTNTQNTAIFNLSPEDSKLLRDKLNEDKEL